MYTEPRGELAVNIFCSQFHITICSLPTGRGGGMGGQIGSQRNGRPPLSAEIRARGPILPSR